MREIRKIEARATGPIQRKRVAAYARVSSGKDAMLHSLSAQVSYYNNYIGKRGDWEFAGIYADEALTGTKGARPEFQRLLEDCRAGEIDMVITKSITRFARNTVILLETVRELKLLGIDVFFQKENIHSISGNGEVMISILASYAQEESRSVSENCIWRIRKKFAEGRPNTGRMLGYRLTDSKLRIITGEAEIVRRIFTDYLSGKGKLAIAKSLNADGVPTINGGIWRENTIRGILQNEKYTGDMLLQKTFIPNHLTKKTHINRGELPKYHVANSHEAIIDKKVFAEVQHEIERRAAKYPPNTRQSNRYPFAGLIQCGQCGKRYQRRIANAGSKYAKPVWICTTFDIQGKAACSSQQIPENILMDKAAEALGLSDFDETVFTDQIAKIWVPAHNKLTFVFRDGHTSEALWQNPSRRESWTTEMRQAARERQQAIIEGRCKK
ncbi:MAG: recombinase family protein [Firmicutes bacterium]|nr:recombinase family protein [Bacillota bacterium]